MTHIWQVMCRSLSWDCCSDEPHLKCSLLAWACIKSKWWHFISLDGIDSALECSTHQIPFPHRVGAWATAARSSCLHMVFSVLPEQVTSRTVCSFIWFISLAAVMFPWCFRALCMRFAGLAAMAAEFWIQMQDVKGVGRWPSFLLKPNLPLLWLCCRAWGIQSKECNYWSEGFCFKGSPDWELPISWRASLSQMEVTVINR